MLALPIITCKLSNVKFLTFKSQSHTFNLPNHLLSSTFFTKKPQIFFFVKDKKNEWAAATRGVELLMQNERKIKNVLSMCFELRRNLMRGELNFPSGVNRQECDKVARHYTQLKNFFLFPLILFSLLFSLVAYKHVEG